MATINGTGRIRVRSSTPDGYYEGGVRVPIPDGYYEGGEQKTLPTDKLSLGSDFVLSEAPNYVGIDVEATEQIFLAVDFGSAVSPS